MTLKTEIKKPFTNVEDFIMKKNYFNDAECERLVRLCKLQSWSPHEWYSSQSETSTAGDTDCKVATVEVNLKTTLEPVLERALQEYQDAVTTDAKQKRFISKMTPIRLNKYGKGRDMKEHNDHISSIFKTKDRGIPILSIIGFLNDDFEGGELYINHKSIDPKRGDILIFPSCFMYPHEVKPVTKGERYSYVAWAF
jgi:predicted 2-oxoglutarate/Fe(II)-dependent dioxygenase YbiX